MLALVDRLVSLLFVDSVAAVRVQEGTGWYQLCWWCYLFVFRLRMGSSRVSTINVLQVLVACCSVLLLRGRVVELSCKLEFDIELSVLSC